MAFLEAVVFLDVVEIVASNDDRALHLRRDAHALQDFPSDADVASERALLVNKISLLGLFRSLEAKADVPPVAQRALRLLPEQPLGADEHRVLKEG